ncbi:MAG: CPBP family intramembrane metalloprotease [Oscillospiraceae bacterium]|nr:CPBP family intramembrane metalloprotease [Oscillospiraceae bacterium]
MKKPIQFIILTCVLSWAVAGVAIILGLRIDTTSVIPYTVFASSYMFIPAICTIILQVRHKEKPFRNLRVSFRVNWWFLIAGIVPIIYAFLTLCINPLFPNISFSATAEGYLASLPAEIAQEATRQLSQFPPAVFMLVTVVQALIAGCTINALFAFGEELGWRGYLLRELQDKKFLHVSLITGIVWGAWHFPLILLGHNYPEHPVVGVGMMIIWCVLLAPVMTYITIKSKSVVAAAIYHGTLNAIAGISGLFIIGGNDLINGVTGIAGFITIILITFAFFLYDKYISKENIFTKSIV